MKTVFRTTTKSPSECDPTHEEADSGRLDLYGNLLFSCRGTGELIDSEQVPWPCQFEAGQLQNGECLLLCDLVDVTPSLSLMRDKPERFAGRTSDGRILKATVQIETNYLPQTPKNQSGVFFALRATRLDFASEVETSAKFAVFGLSNLILRGESIQLSKPGIELIIYPIGDSQVKESRLLTLKEVLVTAELQIAWCPDEEELHRTVDDVCYLLSLAHGTKIQWVYRCDFDADGVQQRSSRFSRSTKQYSALCIIDYRQPKHTESFLAAAFPTYQAKKQSWSLQSVINAHLDAKAGGDFLEMRGLKLAVTVEMLKASFSSATGHSEYLMAPETFETLVPELKDALKPVLEPRLNKSQRQSVYGHLQALNRLQFRDVLRALCDEIGLEIGQEQLTLFVKCRNHLIHYGRFASSPSVPGGTEPIFKTPTHQFYWLVHFVDRLLLRLVDYEGPYVDWAAPGSPVLRDRI